MIPPSSSLAPVHDPRRRETSPLDASSALSSSVAPRFTSSRPSLDDLRRTLQKLCSSALPLFEERETKARGALGTGRARLDRQLPAGGFPCGRITELTGGPSSGKRSVLGAVVTHGLAAGASIAWVDPDGAFDAESAARAEMVLDRLLIVRPDPSFRIASRRISSDLPVTFGRSGPAVHRSGSETSKVSKVDEAFQAADVLLRSRGFDLVVLDLTSLARSPETGALFRLARLAREAETALVLLTEREAVEGGLTFGSAVSLRLRVHSRVAAGERVLVVDVEKSKLGAEGRSIAV